MKTSRLSSLCLMLVASVTFAVTRAAQPGAESSEADSAESTVQAERDRYAGTWRVVSIEASGEVNEEDDRQVIVNNQPDGTWSLTIDGRKVASGTSEMDPLATPKAIDIEITAGDGNGSILRGIYDINQQTRRLCFRGGKGWRPREFSGAAGTDAVLIVFERQ